LTSRESARIEGARAILLLFHEFVDSLFFG
jgi:hypothetical protein